MIDFLHFSKWECVLPENKFSTIKWRIVSNKITPDNPPWLQYFALCRFCGASRLHCFIRCNEKTKITKRAFLIEHFWPSATLAITTKNLPRMGNHLLNVVAVADPNDNNVEGVSFLHYNVSLFNKFDDTNMFHFWFLVAHFLLTVE